MHEKEKARDFILYREENSFLFTLENYRNFCVEQIEKYNVYKEVLDELIEERKNKKDQENG